MISIKSEKSKDSELILRRETERLIQILAKIPRSHVVLLDEQGKESSTPLFLEQIDRVRDGGRDIVYVIGGSYGVDRTLLKPYISEYFALSPMVFPHSLALLVLLEQLYRVREIKRGSKYHHGICK